MTKSIETRGPWEVLDKEVAFENPWIRIDHSNVLNPNGNKGIYSVVHYKNLAIGVVPLDDEINTWLVGQHRFPNDVYSWEIPEGGGLHEHDPVESAKRELLEEVGLKARKWTEIQTMHLSNSVSDEVGIIYLAQDLSMHEANPEDTEDLKIRKVSFDEYFQEVVDGRITDSLSVVAAFKIKHMMDNNQL